MSNCRLFMVPLSQITEHPFVEKTVRDIPEGLLEGWECYVTVFDSNKIVCNSHPVVQRYHYFGGGISGISIRVEGCCFTDGGEYFYFQEGDEETGEGPHWYQSGRRLKFIRKRENKDVYNHS